jgi:hypothetical protein
VFSSLHFLRCILFFHDTVISASEQVNNCGAIWQWSHFGRSLLAGKRGWRVPGPHKKTSKVNEANQQPKRGVVADTEGDDLIRLVAAKRRISQWPLLHSLNQPQHSTMTPPDPIYDVAGYHWSEGEHRRTSLSSLSSGHCPLHTTTTRSTPHTNQEGEEIFI